MQFARRRVGLDWLLGSLWDGAHAAYGRELRTALAADNTVKGLLKGALIEWSQQRWACGGGRGTPPARVLRGSNGSDTKEARLLQPHSDFERTYMLGTVLVILLILMLLGALPTWPHSRNWGYYPSGGLGLVLAILVVLLLLGRI